MPISKELLAEFDEDYYYHVFCKSVGNVNLFRDPADKFHFLKFYFGFLNDFVDTYAYHLLDNHVHFVLKIKRYTEIINTLNTYPKEFLIETQRKFLLGSISLHTLIAKQFQRLNILYTNYYNKLYFRKGHLFIRPFRRKRVDSEQYLTRLIVYIHANEVHHRLSDTYENSKWSSYSEILGHNHTTLKRKEILELFGGREKFMSVHKEMAFIYSVEAFE